MATRIHLSGAKSKNSSLGQIVRPSKHGTAQQHVLRNPQARAVHYACSHVTGSQDVGQLWSDVGKTAMAGKEAIVCRVLARIAAWA